MKKFFISILIVMVLVYGSVMIFANSNQNTGSKIISVDKAKQIALNDAKLKKEDVKFIRVELDTDERVYKYDIEFYNKNTEYDYEINAFNGKILEKDLDIENYSINENIQIQDSDDYYDDNEDKYDDDKYKKQPVKTDKNLLISYDNDDDDDYDDRYEKDDDFYEDDDNDDD